MKVDEMDNIPASDIIIAMGKPDEHVIQDTPMIPQQIWSPTEDAYVEENEAIQPSGNVANESIRVIDGRVFVPVAFGVPYPKFPFLSEVASAAPPGYFDRSAPSFNTLSLLPPLRSHTYETIWNCWSQVV